MLSLSSSFTCPSSQSSHSLSLPISSPSLPKAFLAGANLTLRFLFCFLLMTSPSSNSSPTSTASLSMNWPTRDDDDADGDDDVDGDDLDEWYSVIVDFCPFFSVCSTLTENGTDESIFSSVVPASLPVLPGALGSSGIEKSGATGLGIARRFALRLFFVTWLGSTDKAKPWRWSMRDPFIPDLNHPSNGPHILSITAWEVYPQQRNPSSGISAPLPAPFAAPLPFDVDPAPFAAPVPFNADLSIGIGFVATLCFDLKNLTGTNCMGESSWLT